MRLATCLLSSALFAATPPELPWKLAPSVSWRVEAPDAESDAPALPTPLPVEPSGALQVSLYADGTLHIVNAKGLVRLRTTMPGRPLKLWRDAGIPLDPKSNRLFFPKTTPLSSGLKHMPIGASDFRSGLEGLLWILDDSERYLTVVHPATCQVVYLPLPTEGSRFDLTFLPTRLSLKSTTRSHTIPWLGLLPQLLRLATPPPEPKPGTATNPFPRE